MAEDWALTNEQRLRALERWKTKMDKTVEALQTAETALANAFNTFAADVNQTIADLEEKEAAGGRITSTELEPITEAANTLASAVQAADVQVKGEDPGPTPPPQSLYVFIGEGEPSPDWTIAPFVEKGSGKTLYYFSGDTPGAQPPTTAGVGQPGWELFTGEVTA